MRVFLASHLGKWLLLLACNLFFVFGVGAAVMDNSKIQYDKQNLRLATFAGGCFWCMAPPFEQLPGVVTVISGYSGGHKDNPTYEEVSSGATGHFEVIQVVYDSTKITYKKLLDVYWRQIDPTDDYGSFVDKGKQYRSAIFYHDAEQLAQATASKSAFSSSGFLLV